MNEGKIQQVVRIEKKLGRLELLNWLNESLQTDYAKVQDCADGIAYCQLVDSLAPGVVPLQKLCFSCRILDDRVKNLRILEEAMHKLGIRKDLDVAGIAKGKFQENNEFLQWLHALLHKNASVPPDKYKAFERRWAAQVRQKKGIGGVGSRSKGRQHNLNNNLVPNEFEWHEGPVRDAPAQSKQSGQVLNKPARQKVDMLTRQDDAGHEARSELRGVESGGAALESGRLATESKGPQPRAMAKEGGLTRLENEEWEGLDVRESWTSNDEYARRESGIRDPRWSELDGAPSQKGEGAAGAEAGPERRGAEGNKTSRQQAELESLIAYLESELLTKLQSYAGVKKEVLLVDKERKFYYDKLCKIEQLCEHTESRARVTPMVVNTVNILSNEEDCPAR